MVRQMALAIWPLAMLYPVSAPPGSATARSTPFLLIVSVHADLGRGQITIWGATSAPRNRL